MINGMFPYVGGKRALLKIILECFPERYERYIEPFGGSAAVLLGKEPTAFEVYNDYDGDLVNLFQCVKFRPFRLINELRRFSFHSRLGFPLLERILKGENVYEKYLADEMEAVDGIFEAGGFKFGAREVKKIKKILNDRAKDFDTLRAAAFYLQCHSSYAAGRTSVDCRPVKILRGLPAIWGVHNRIKDVFLECKDFEALIGHYDRDGAFFYLDPPYYLAENAYHARFETTDHSRLRDKLKTVSGKWLLSYNDCPEILELYRDFHIIRVKRLNSIAQQFEAGCEYKELLIANYDIEECRKSKSGQIGISEFLERRETEEWIVEGGVTV